jgi:hypothetical protein
MAPGRALLLPDNAGQTGLSVILTKIIGRQKYGAAQILQVPAHYFLVKALSRIWAVGFQKNFSNRRTLPFFARIFKTV